VQCWEGVSDTNKKTNYIFLEKGIYINIPASASIDAYSYSLLHHKQITATQSETQSFDLKKKEKLPKSTSRKQSSRDLQELTVNFGSSKSCSQAPKESTKWL
jgi:hypothetical protein